MPKTVMSAEQVRRRREVKKLANRMMASMSLSEAARTAQEYASVPRSSPRSASCGAR